MKGLKVFRLPVMPTEHHQMIRQDKPLAEANTNTFIVISSSTLLLTLILLLHN